MIDPANVPLVAEDEQLARFVLQANQFRISDQTVKQDAFIPYPHLELSVTRHLQATEEEIWGIGVHVAQMQGKRLYGRADVIAEACGAQNLRVEAAPVEDNPNHANVVGWPTTKQDQKAVALKLARAARFFPNAMS